MDNIKLDYSRLLNCHDNQWFHIGIKSFLMSWFHSEHCISQCVNISIIIANCLQITPDVTWVTDFQILNRQNDYSLVFKLLSGINQANATTCFTNGSTWMGIHKIAMWAVTVGYTILVFWDRRRVVVFSRLGRQNGPDWACMTSPGSEKLSVSSRHVHCHFARWRLHSNIVAEIGADCRV